LENQGRRQLELPAVAREQPPKNWITEGRWEESGMKMRLVRLRLERVRRGDGWSKRNNVPCHQTQETASAEKDFCTDSQAIVPELSLTMSGEKRVKGSSEGVVQ